MFPRYLIFVFVITVFGLSACHVKEEEAAVSTADSTANYKTQTIKTPAGNRFFVMGDFNGDGRLDTLFESYYSTLNRKEVYKHYHPEEVEKDNVLIGKQKANCKLYSHNPAIDTFVVSDEYLQSGLLLIENLGDLNGDKTDELGYIVDLADISFTNAYIIISYVPATREWKELLRFKINEMKSFDEENMFEDLRLVKITGPKQIHYKLFNESDFVEEKTFNFN